MLSERTGHDIVFCRAEGMKRLLHVFGSTRKADVVISQNSAFFGNMQSSAVILRRRRNEKVQKNESLPYDGLDEEGQ